MLLAAACTCGYRAQNLTVGAGMLDFRDRFAAPALCRDCGEVVTGNYLEPEPGCPHGGQGVTFYDDPAVAGPAGAPLVPMWQSPDGRSFELAMKATCAPAATPRTCISSLSATSIEAADTSAFRGSGYQT